MAQRDIQEENKQLLKVLGKQKDDIAALNERNRKQNEQLNQLERRLSALKERAHQLTSTQNAELPTEHHMPISTNFTPKKISPNDIPSWESIAETAAKYQDITLSDLLTFEEIAHARAKAERITEDFSNNIRLTKDDLSLLAFATSLQSARWLMVDKVLKHIDKPLTLLPVLTVDESLQLENLVGTEDIELLESEVNQEFQMEKRNWVALISNIVDQYQKINPQILKKFGLPDINQLSMPDKVTLVGKQAAVPLAINIGIAQMHNKTYDPQKDGERKYFDARTRKIILYSNILASAGNITYTTTTEDWTRVDVGGILISATRLLEDIGYLTKLEDKYLKEELEKIWKKEMNDLEEHFSD
jgi:hypothetical protein